ncbi:Concanavalin A-like lectin/glucanase domain containing protein, partial [Thalictrum thalictroides]
METGIIVAAVVLSVAVVLVVIGLIRWWCCSYKRRKEFSEETGIRSNESLHSGIAKLQVAYETNNHKNAASIRKSFHDLDSKRKVNYYVLQRGGISMKSFFSWADHPSLVSEAVEHGWPRFGFNGHNMSSPSARSVLMGLCVTGDQARESAAEVSWEISSESADYMQKVRLNSGLRKGCIDFTTPNPLSVSCVTQTALPLPGPFLGNSSFPQEAYFEITTLSSREGDARKERKKEGEKLKLIQENVNVNTQLDEANLVIKDERKSEAVLVSLGLSVGGSYPRRLPGSYPGSIGFNSNGSVYID